MKLKSLSIENFRSYAEKITVNFSDFTALVGRNDAGKSSILEALHIFFYGGGAKSLVRLDKSDLNKSVENNKIIISAIFDDLPEEISIDDSNKTTLKGEYLLNSQGELEVVKIFEVGASVKTSVRIRALHPTNDACGNLLQKRQTELLSIVDRLNIPCGDKRKNAEMRAAIWSHFNDNLNLEEVEVDIASKDGDIKSIWEKLQLYLPQYSLFQSDRKNSVEDSEVQDPLKDSVRRILKAPDIQKALSDIATRVKSQLESVAEKTMLKLEELNPDVAASLKPDVPDAKWADAFKGISITGEDEIPVDKRGSGVRRLVLLSFFQAEAERRLSENDNSNIIYAIEEPETSQHKDHQERLIKALKALSENTGTQVIITTHSGHIVKRLRFEDIRLISYKDGVKKVTDIGEKALSYLSLNEVNYLAFGDVTEEYHNDLYGYMQSKAIEEDAKYGEEKYFEEWLARQGVKKEKSWTRCKNGEIKQPYACSLQTYIRNSIHHPENRCNTQYSTEELLNSITEMRRIIQEKKL
ncbi:MAG: ATP-binding protein [Opitutales bacterium]|nr:ATP-binding protein [Opitutales bacterium]